MGNFIEECWVADLILKEVGGLPVVAETVSSVLQRLKAGAGKSVGVLGGMFYSNCHWYAAHVVRSEKWITC